MHSYRGTKSVPLFLYTDNGKYDIVCTFIQMMPNYKDLKPMEVIGRIVAHEMSLKDKEDFTTTQVVLTKPHVMLPHHQVRNKHRIEPNGEELQQVLQE